MCTIEARICPDRTPGYGFSECIRIFKNDTVIAEIKIPSRLANSRSSVSCASIDKTCLSSTSVDLRAYKKNFCWRGNSDLINR